MLTKIMVTEEFGRGVYAASRIEPAQIVAKCEILVLSPEDTIKVNETELKHYTFKFNESQDCLVLGDGEIFNHADRPNVSFDLEYFEGRKFMVFRAIEGIESGEQLFIDYSADVDVNVQGYIDQKSLMGG